MADQQPIRTPANLPYGQATELANAQRQQPLPQAPTPKRPTMSQAAGAADGMWQAPVVPLSAPSQRPGEHVMDGVDAGPGRTAAQAGIPGHEQNAARDGVLNTLRGLYERFPLSSLHAAIRDFAQRPPYTMKDLTLDFHDPADAAGMVGSRPIPPLAVSDAEGPVEDRSPGDSAEDTRRGAQ
jgi:hypothetical protein